MKTAVQYVNDEKGNTQAVQIPLAQWSRLINKLSKYEEMLKVKSDLTRAFAQVKKMKQGKLKKQSLGDFLNEL